MIAGMIGDIVGSVYEAHQWQTKELPLFAIDPVATNPQIKALFKEAKWVRPEPDWTDDTLCNLALFSAYQDKKDIQESLLHFCNKYKSEARGFGGSFMKWLDNPVPYESYANGSIMRVGFIPFLPLTLEEKLQFGYDCTAVSHNHPDSFDAVHDFIIMVDKMGNQWTQTVKDKRILKEYLIHNNYHKDVEALHEEFKFELNARQTLLQACSVVLESNSMEEILRNTFYVGGDSDTLACVACNLASRLYILPDELLNYAKEKMKNYPDLNALMNQAMNQYLADK